MTKAVPFHCGGREVAGARRRHPIPLPALYHTERHADRMWADTSVAIHRLAGTAGTALGHGAGIDFINAIDADRAAAPLVEQRRLDSGGRRNGQSVRPCLRRYRSSANSGVAMPITSPRERMPQTCPMEKVDPRNKQYEGDNEP